MAFLIAASKGDSLYVFAPDTDCIIYTEELITDVKGRCEEYVKLFSSYKQDIIKSASLKLWHYYANKKVEFTDEEKKLLSQLGIRL
ncbi:hypothetical protein AB1303_02815 [Saccharolobus solfataricus]|nr:hypothetical protein [Saccharolobus solfataricus]